MFKSFKGQLKGEKELPVVAAACETTQSMNNEDVHAGGGGQATRAGSTAASDNDNNKRHNPQEGHFDSLGVESRGVLLPQWARVRERAGLQAI